jgi:hypothetical protein
VVEQGNPFSRVNSSPNCISQCNGDRSFLKNNQQNQGDPPWFHYPGGSNTLNWCSGLAKAKGGSLSSHPQPHIVHLDMLDTDYAKMAAGEPIPDHKQQRLSGDNYDFTRLGKHIARYRYGGLDQQSQDDILCTLGTTAGLFTLADTEDMNDRLRYTGHFYLTPGERQQVINWLIDELGIDLEAASEVV